MNLTYLLTHVAVLVVSGVIIVAVGYLFIKNDLRNCFNVLNRAARKEDHQQLLPLRLQAHERLIVLIERINPSNLFVRLHEPGVSLKEFQRIILNEVRSEYQHNITQQLYVNTEIWNVIRKLKEDTLAMVNNAVSGLPEGALGVDLSRSILQHMAGLENNPYDLTLDLIKRDIHQLF